MCKHFSFNATNTFMRSSAAHTAENTAITFTEKKWCNFSNIFQRLWASLSELMSTHFHQNVLYMRDRGLFAYTHTHHTQRPPS